jgi:hypothetical protein
VEAVQNAVDHRSEENAAAGDKNQATKERVAGGKDFGGRARQIRAEDGAFAAHQHGGFEEGIKPMEAGDEPVSQDAESQGETNKREGDEEVVDHASEEDGVRGDRLVMVLKGIFIS